MTNPMHRNVGQVPADQQQSAFPFRSGYVAPDQGTATAVGINAPAGKFTGSPIAVADASIRHAANLHQTFLATIDPPTYSPDGLAKQCAVFKGTDAMGAATAAVKAVNDLADAAAQNVADVRKSLSTSDGDVSTAMAAQAYWNRKVRLLDSIADGPQLLSAAQGLVADASPPEIAVLATELPDYLTSRHQADTSWLDTAIANQVPDLAQAIADASVAAKAAAVTNWNYQQLANRVNGTTTPVGYRGPTFCPLPT